MAITRNHALLLGIIAELFAMLRSVDLGSNHLSGSSPLSVGCADTSPQRGEVKPTTAALTSPRLRGSEGRARPVARPGTVSAKPTERGLPQRQVSANEHLSFTLPYRLYHAILLILRPAESALRRLIVIAARGLTLKPRAAHQALPNFPAFAATNSVRIPSFALLDPLKHFSLEDFNQNANPHTSFASSWEPTDFTPSFSQPDEPINAAQLFSRMRALRAALSDIPKQARRLARWQARRDELLKAKRPTRISIFPLAYHPAGDSGAFMMSMMCCANATDWRFTRSTGRIVGEPTRQPPNSATTGASYLLKVTGPDLGRCFHKTNPYNFRHPGTAKRNPEPYLSRRSVGEGGCRWRW